ncbi:MAG: cupin domain-containing protein [Gemmatimonadota bacterium]
MKKGIRRLNEHAEFQTEERCHIVEISGKKDDPDLSIARARVEPGVTTQLHTLDIAERYLVVSGEGEMEYGTDVVAGESDPDLERRSVGPGDVVLVPPGVAQRITNKGDEDLVFFCVCTPAWEEGVYNSLE